MVRFMDGHAWVACAGPRVRYPNGRVQPSAFHFPTPARVALGAVTLQRAGWIESGGEEISKVDWVHGCAMLLRTDAFRLAGGFDEDFYMYCEDVDLCQRLHDGGYRVVFFPPAGLTHHEYGSSGGVSERRIYQHARSRGLYTRKHHGEVAERAVQTLTAGMFVGRIAASRLMGRPPEERARFAAHVRASLRPDGRPAIEDTAAERNGAVA
jgi:GT2 family glycosyltransferase